jgi:hypothetical protein
MISEMDGGDTSCSWFDLRRVACVCRHSCMHELHRYILFSVKCTSIRMSGSEKSKMHLKSKDTFSFFPTVRNDMLV